MSITTPARTLTDMCERARALDAPAQMLAGKVRRWLAAKNIKEAISGTWLGHPLHPPLTDVVIGSLLSASILDLAAPRSGGRAARRLIAVGIVTAVPTAVTGLSDWADTELSDERARRMGLVHAAANTSSLLMYTASLAARWRGKRTKGVLLGIGGAGALGVGGYLGGHLSYVRGVGVNQTAFDSGPQEWRAVAQATEVVEGQPHTVEVDGVPVLLARRDGIIHVINARCSHRGCTLGGGDVDGEIVTCPCHGSQFSIHDGTVLQGPAITGQPVFESRETTGEIEIRLVRS